MYLLAYILIFPIIWVISNLPFKLFYFFSDVIFFLVYYVVGYRKTLVTENLELVFPDKSKKEIKIIRKKFYKHMCDMFLEMTKTMSISEAEMLKRFKYTNPEFIQDLEKRKSVAIMTPHYANWEWTVILQHHVNAQCYGIYKRIRNPYFDKLVKDIRAKYNGKLITTKESIGVILGNKRNNSPAIYGFASDQSPKLNKAFHWQDFMGHNVPIHTGAEMLSKKCDLAVCYLKTKRVKRGYYEATFIPMTENAKDFENYGLTDLFIKMVEEQLHETPEYYLWTHNRWKHRGKNPKQKSKL